MVGLLIAAYLFIRSNAALLGDDTALQIASSDILGNPLYGPSCSRAFYVGQVERRADSTRNGAVRIRFFPIAGKEAQCPTVVVIVDRKTGEAWLSKP